MLSLPLIVSPSWKAFFAASRQEQFFMRVASLRRNSAAKNACLRFFRTPANAISVTNGFLTGQVGATAHGGREGGVSPIEGWSITFTASFVRVGGLVRRVTKFRSAEIFPASKCAGKSELRYMEETEEDHRLHRRVRVRLGEKCP